MSEPVNTQDSGFAGGHAYVGNGTHGCDVLLNGQVRCGAGAALHPAVVTCAVKLLHGPGHQSSTTCDVRGPHTVHHVVYGELMQDVEWTGGNAFTGVFDEPDGIHPAPEPKPEPRTWPRLDDPPADVKQVRSRSGTLWTRMDEDGYYWSALGWPGGVSWAQVLCWGPVTEVRSEETS